MQSQLVAVTYDTPDPARLAQFWAALLGRELWKTGSSNLTGLDGGCRSRDGEKSVPRPAIFRRRPVEFDERDDADGVLLPGADGQLGLRFVADDAPPHLRHRMHLHLTSTSLADQEQTVATAVELGAGHLDVGQRPEEGHIVLSDPGGYAFCVIAPGNGYLAGCGRLGELSCDGTRDVGLFWSEVLGWPLVWDRNEETAVQSPRGGTKVSWGGEPVSSRQGADRQRLELLAAGGDLDAEAERIVGLGARRLRTTARGVLLLADPDGTEFRLRAA